MNQTYYSAFDRPSQVDTFGRLICDGKTWSAQEVNGEAGIELA